MTNDERTTNPWGTTYMHITHNNTHIQTLEMGEMERGRRRSSIGGKGGKWAGKAWKWGGKPRNPPPPFPCRRRRRALAILKVPPLIQKRHQRVFRVPWVLGHKNCRSTSFRPFKSWLSAFYRFWTVRTYQACQPVPSCYFTVLPQKLSIDFSMLLKVNKIGLTDSIFVEYCNTL